MPDTLELKQLNKQLEQKTADLKTMTDNLPFDTDGNVQLTTDQATTFRTAVQETKQLRDFIQDMTGFNEVKAWMEQPAGPSVAAQDAAATQSGRFERKSLGDLFVESDEYRNRNMSRPTVNFEVDIAAPEFKAIWGGGQTPTGGSQVLPALGEIQNIGIRDIKLRQQHVRDLFPKRTTTATKIVSVRETGFTNNAAQVSQRNSDNTDWVDKPESNLTYAPVSYEIARIAHWIKAHKDMLSDVPMLKDAINGRLLDGIAFAEDRDILWGTGGSERLTGIMNTPGIQLYPGVSSDKYTKQIRKAITRAMLAEYDPTGIIVHPIDWETLELEETDDGHYRIAINIAVGGQKRIWSLDIVASTAMTQGKYLLGNFNYGASLYDREKANVQISTENDKDFQRNLVTILAESRLAVVCDRPESFVYGTLETYVAA